MRDMMIKVRVTAAEATALEKHAAATGLPVSTWMRSVALAAAREAKPATRRAK